MGIRRDAVVAGGTAQGGEPQRRVPLWVSGLAANPAQLPVGTVRTGASMLLACEPSELGQVALRVALADIDGQVGDPLGVPSVLAYQAGPRARRCG